MDALCRRGVARCRLRALAGGAAGAAGAAGGDDALHDNLADLLKFTDLTDIKVPTQQGTLQLRHVRPSVCGLARRLLVLARKL